MHDWTRVSAGIYHAMHNSWITHLQEALNAGLLPPAYYALGEQRSGNIEPDVLTLRTEETDTADAEFAASSGDSEEAVENLEFYLRRRRTVVVRHTSGDRIVALIEIVSSANKHSRQSLDDFVDKVVTALRGEIHVLVIDPLPPGRHDADGIHGAVWDRLSAGDYEPPDDLRLTLVSYRATEPITAYVEPFGVGTKLTDMPLFLTPEHYIPAPLETTYMQAWAGVPQRWRRVIEADL
jgi:hypothetical protein